MAALERESKVNEVCEEALRTIEAQQAEMTGMQKVETTIGEDRCKPFPLPQGGDFGSCLNGHYLGYIGFGG
jgi:hypothetical protein